MEKKKNGSFKNGLICGILIAVVVFGGIYEVKHVFSSFTGESRVSKEADKKLDLLEGLVDELYLYRDDIDDDVLKEGIYKGYVEAIGDPYTVYYDEAETKELFESFEGEFTGVGAVLSQNINTMEIVINNIYEDSPADKAGLLNGDIIVQVDDRELQGEELSEVVTWIRGDKGTDVDIYAYRESEGKIIKCTATRDVIKAVTVADQMLDDNIGYIKIAEFDSVTYDQFVESLDNLESEGMEGLIIDLRGNPGGNLDTTVEMLKEILPEGIIVSTKDRYGNEQEYTNDEDNTFDKPLVLLVDEYSASAAEIFSGAVKDYGIGTLVGTNTFGKGIVQNVLDLQDGTSLKVTVSEYFTPSGENIHGKGIAPDVVVEFPEDITEITSDIQFDKAVEIIKEQLK